MSYPCELINQSTCQLFRAAKVRQLNGGDKPGQSYFAGFINVFTFIIINKKIIVLSIPAV